MNETEQMLTSVLNCGRTELYTRPVSLSEKQSERLELMRSRFAAGEPLQYVIGQTEFMGHSISVNEDVLIPRPETEILVEHVIDHLISYSEDTIRILDLGTGSGNIDVALAKALPKAKITSIDISGSAQHVARSNAQQNNVLEQIDFVQQDMTDFLCTAIQEQSRYTLIISNPPYIPTSALAALPRDVQKEPKLALDGGGDGYQFYRTIAKYAPQLLTDTGSLWLEIGDGQENVVKSLFDKTDAFVKVSSFMDYTQTPRIIAAIK